MRRSTKRYLIGGAIVACVGVATLGRAQFTPFSDRSRGMLEGNWQSCREADGQYGERVYDGRWPGVQPFELHMGPYHEFALFRGVQDDHRDHAGADNLLKPHTVEITANRGKHTWDIAGLHFEVTLAGGSREECESWFVSLKQVPSSSNSSSH